MIVELSLMKRISKKAGVTDGLVMRYDGNRLKGITDEYGNSNQYNVKEFHSADPYNTNDKFIYDANGNMVRDFDRNIVTIRYNCLNLPDTIQFANGNQILNHYDATGMKYCTDYITPYTNMTTPVPVDSTCQWTFGEEDMDWSGKWYLGSRQYSFYKDLDVGTVCSLDRVQNPYGYHKGSNYYYYLKDHLGNVREVWYDAQWVVPRPPKSPYLPDATVQRTQYYAHGLPYAEGTGISTQPNKYNGKEFIEMHGYDTYDYGWRGLYSAIGRFTTIDPLAEKYYDVSPYAYCANNPIMLVDPDGREMRSGIPAKEQENGVWTTAQSSTYIPQTPHIPDQQMDQQVYRQKCLTESAGTLSQSPSNYEKWVDQTFAPHEKLVAGNPVVQAAVVATAVVPMAAEAAMIVGTAIETSIEVQAVAGAAEGVMKGIIDVKGIDVPPDVYIFNTSISNTVSDIINTSLITIYEYTKNNE
ncbi:MAG: hypothetical protein EOM76_02810 [Sphingobacteriia bacterium]|nr:hypothetical protein [Sphingobacteriia bacterium]